MMSRSPSPTKEGFVSARSKLQAMLDRTGSDDDSEGGDDDTPMGTPKKTSRSTDAMDEDDDEDEDEEDIVRPRGRVAAQMRVETAPETTATTQEDSDDDDDGPVPARNRLQRRQQRQDSPAQDDSESDSPAQASQPGLFVSPNPSPQKQQSLSVNDDDNDEPPLPMSKSERFAALVNKKRQERLARDAEEARLKAEKLALQSSQRGDTSDDDDELDDGGITDDEGGRRLTQETAGKRQQRNASKRALEEMNRETQRMAREMQLAHEAKTKKKIPKSALFEKFNFRPQVEEQQQQPVAGGSASEVASSAVEKQDGGDGVAGDVEMGDTPPTSPPLEKKTEGAMAAAVAATVDTEPLAPEETLVKSPPKPKRRVRVVVPALEANVVALDSDSEGEIIIRPATKLDAVFDRAPLHKTKEDRSMQLLRRLAHQSSPSKRARAPKGLASAVKSLTPAELQQSLALQAREQAKAERERRVEMLKAQGIVVQTREEREREERMVEDLVTRARREAEEIMARERDESKKERREQVAKGEVDPLAWDDSDDEYEDEEVGKEVELSGSEEEGEEGEEGDEEEEEEEEEEEKAGNGLVDDAAEDDESEEEAGNKDDGDNDDDEMEVADTPVKSKSRKPRRQAKTAVLSDDDDEEEEEDEPVILSTPFVNHATPAPKSRFLPGSASRNSPAMPMSALRSATKTFIPGLPVQSPANLGLTQMFASTMEDGSQSDDDEMDLDGTPTRPTPSVMPDFDTFPDPSISDDDAGDNVPAAGMVLDSQRTQTQGLETQGGRVNLAVEQSQMHNLDSIPRWEPSTQMTDMMMAATQDGGLAVHSPLQQRFVSIPPSTAATVLINDDEDDGMPTSPLVRRGRLRRKADMTQSSTTQKEVHITQPTAPLPADDDDDVVVDQEDPFGFGTTATATAATAATNMLEKLQKAAARKQEKKLARMKKAKRRAGGMVEEQAEESEDEYAGLGGADGEDSDDDSDDASVKDMIDDAGGEDVDETKLAAFFADRQRASDEKETDKLFRDITNGMLRRKRDHGSLSDSDDDNGEARRRMKRRQFAKMQRALFSDERVKKIAEKPGNLAFLRTIEDRDDDDDHDDEGGMDWMGVPDSQEEGGSQSQSQSQGQNETVIPNTLPDNNAQAAAPSSKKDRRRRQRLASRKPATLGEIRESLSSLLDEPNESVVIPATADPGSDDIDPENHHNDNDDNDEGDEENTSRRRWTKSSSTTTVINRISSKRTTSSSSSTNRMAFAASSGSGSNTFKVPALLRRATTNSSVLSSGGTNTSGGFATEMQAVNGSSGAGGGFGDGGKVNRGAGKRSGVSGMLTAAREQERRAVVDAGDKRREQKKVKGAEKRGKVVGGLFGAGRFE